jgi:glucose 1-dehydrogenase
MTQFVETKLTGQRAIVTGASSGIGAAIARSFAAAGAQVVVNYSRGPEAAEAVVSQIKSAHGQAFAVQADVSKEPDVSRLFDTAVEVMGGLDILVNNAGIQRDSRLVDMSLEQWNEVIGVNLTGQFLCTRSAVREFLRRGPSPALSRATGKILFISSVHDIIPWAGHANYAAAKGGLSMFMKTVAQEVAEYRIRVNAISPGAIKTAINRDAWSTSEAEQALLRLIPYGRVGNPEDIGRAAVWLCSDDSDYVHGATLYVDGGMTLYPEFREGG